MTLLPKRHCLAVLLSFLSYGGSAMADQRLSYVNARPQFNVTEKFFALYIGIWRGFDTEELAHVHDGSFLISKRDIRWQVGGCDDDVLEHEDSETIWLLDELRLDVDANVIPITEAPRAGYRYFSLANIHGLYLRGTGDFVRPARTPGESSAAYRERVEAARKAWWKSASPVGTTGKIWFDLTMQLMPLEAADQDNLRNSFIEFNDYQRLGAEDADLAAIFRRTAPNRWPVHYDERAHKPHAFAEPQIWNGSDAPRLRTDRIQARLEWDWCDVEAPLKAQVVVPRGGILAPGPNRTGRTDHGPVTIPVVEE